MPLVKDFRRFRAISPSRSWRDCVLCQDVFRRSRAASCQECNCVVNRVPAQLLAAFCGTVQLCIITAPQNSPARISTAVYTALALVELVFHLPPTTWLSCTVCARRSCIAFTIHFQQLLDQTHLSKPSNVSDFQQR